jgi:16S rRNA (adenine1518-N6/adenine1519-N6)-dimethyltransferase
MTMTHPANQTLSFLLARFREVGIEPRNRHGQNFLIDLNLVRMLVDAADLGPDDVVLEVGTGTGSLTGLLAERAAAVVSVEIDPQLYQLASEELFTVDNVTLLGVDALKNKNTLNPAVLAAVDEQLRQRPGARFKLAANLPFNVATPILSNLLECATPPCSMTVTIQRELADRITAVPGTKAYGALSIWIQSQCRAELVRLLPPSVFWPRPKVTSAILHIERDADRRAKIADLGFFHAFIRGLFCHRRKFLRSVLVAGHKETLGKSGVDAVLGELGLSPESRAEQLDVPTVLALSDAVQRHQLGGVVPRADT